MRKIKFRAWDIELKEMTLGIDNIKNKYEGIYLFDELLNPQVAGCPELIIMQFTGLVDKQGKEIYEGDIFKFLHNFGNKNKFKDFVEFDVKRGVWCLGKRGYILTSIYDIEVIGNIYENSELLKNKGDEFE